MRRVLLTLSLLAALLACPRPQPDDKPTGPVPPVPRVEPARPTQLAGHPIVEQEDGPWRTRRTQAPDGAATVAEREGIGGLGLAALAEEAPSAVMVADEVSDGFASGAAGMGATGTGRGGGGSAPRAKLAEPSGLASSRRMPPPPPGVPPAEPMPSLPGRARMERVVADSPLKAGSTDDNADFAEFLKFLATWTDRPETAAQHQFLDVRDRRYIEVVDVQGRPLPGVMVDVYDAKSERPLLHGTTYGDGRVPFFPKVQDPKNEAESWLVQARLGEVNANSTWNREGDTFRVALDTQRADAAIPVDVTFIIDTTGSMADEIQRIKETLLSVTEALRSSGNAIDLRYAAVLYKDVGDEYVTRTHPFTADIAAFDTALKTVTAGGGGDGPESLNQGLAEAVHGVSWREHAAKVAFLIADAEPHMDYDDDIPYGESAKDAVARGIRIHSVAASGLGPFGTLVFRQVAQYTQGKFIFIEYGSTAATAASHGVAGQVKSNNLDDIVLEQIRWEIDHYARKPDAR